MVFQAPSERLYRQQGLQGKVAAHFTKFLEKQVNLNNSRIELLTERVETIQDYVIESNWVARPKRFSPQGSWAHKTIIKPPGEGGFDADLLVVVDPVTGWSAADYVNDLYRAFKASDRYKDKVTQHTRCVAIEYANDFSVDVVPYVIDRVESQTGFDVCNRTDNVFEATDSEEYTAWLERKNIQTGSNSLRNVLKLLKYLRDTKTTFSCKSILLTTLVAARVEDTDVLYQPTNFPDLPTALKTLIGRLDDYLKARLHFHKVENPVVPTEDFVRHWDDDKYQNFREMIHKYRGWVDEAYGANNEADAVKKWRRIFGDEFASGFDIDSDDLTEATLPVLVKAGRFGDAVDAVVSAGRSLLRQVPAVLPWVKPAPFRFAPDDRQLVVTVRASKSLSRVLSSTSSAIVSGDVLPKGRELLFEAVGQHGLPFGKEYRVQWQVVNTDQAARSALSLRGGFYSSDKLSQRWETTQYRGVHWVQAFVVRQRDKVCVGQSDRFFVVIEEKRRGNGENKNCALGKGRWPLLL